MTKSERKAYEENLDTITSSASLTRACLPVGDCPVCGAPLFERETGSVSCAECGYFSEH